MIWQYCVKELLSYASIIIVEKLLNELGKDGWELTGIVHYTGEGTTNKVLYIFKRRVD